MPEQQTPLIVPLTEEQIDMVTGGARVKFDFFSISTSNPNSFGGGSINIFFGNEKIGPIKF